MFASQVKKQVTIDNVVYDIRALSWHSLEKAKQASFIASAAQMRAMGGEVFERLNTPEAREARKAYDVKKATPEGRAAERYSSYDREEVLVSGLTGWSIPDIRISRETVKDLLPAIVDRLHREILDLSLPPLDAEVAEAAQGKS